MRPEPALTFTVEVTGGLDGALRVASMLRARRYRVLTMTLNLDDDLDNTPRCRARVTGRLDLPEGDAGLLLARLDRIPAVVTASLLSAGLG